MHNVFHCASLAWASLRPIGEMQLSVCTEAVNVSFTDTKLAILKITVKPASGESYSVNEVGSEISAQNGDAAESLSCLKPWLFEVVLVV